MEKKIRKVIFIVSMVAVCCLSFANEKEKDIEKYSQSLTLNPIFIPFGIVHTEYDYKIGEKTSIGIASWLEYKEW